MHIRIKSIWITRGPKNTRATLTKKWIAARVRGSTHSDGKHSRDRLACPDQVHSDRGAAQWEGVLTNACVSAFQFASSLHSQWIC